MSKYKVSRPEEFKKVFSNVIENEVKREYEEEKEYWDSQFAKRPWQFEDPYPFNFGQFVGTALFISWIVSKIWG